MASDLWTLTPRRPDRLTFRFHWWWIAALLAVVLIVAAIPRLLANPSVVPQVTITNPTTYAMDIDVTGARRDGWMGLGTAEREHTTVMRDVIDQGDTWIFRFTSQGVDAGELRVTRLDLQRSRWRVVIPSAVGKRLAREGATPTPPASF